MSEANEKSLAQKYEQGQSDVSPFITRAKTIANLTIPSLVPIEDEYETSRTLPDTAQSTGARLVKGLASKLLQTLYPTNESSFRMRLSNKTIKEIEDKLAEAGLKEDELKTEKVEAVKEAEKALSKIEKTVLEDIENTGDRGKLNVGFMLLIVHGNYVIEQVREGLRVFGLGNFVVERAPRGDLLQLIIKEKASLAVLKEREPELVESLDIKKLKKSGQLTGEDTIVVYTTQKLDGDKWQVWQEVDGKKIPSSYGTYPKDAPRFIVVAPNRIDGENYARPYAEDYISDLETLEILTRAVREGTVAAAKLLTLVNPTGVTEAQDIADSDNGAVIEGRDADVSFLQTNKGTDFRIASELIDRIERRLARAFLLTESIRRDAERVTAEELRIMALDLETTLGGLYSILGDEKQRPLIMGRLRLLRKEKAIPRLPTAATRVAIITGLEALGRGNDWNRTMQFLTSVKTALGEEGVKRINKNKILELAAMSVQFDPDDVILPEEQVVEMDQQAQAAALMQQATPEMLRQGGQLMAQASAEPQPTEEGEVSNVW